MKRRDFVRVLGGVVAVGAAAGAVGACGGGDDGGSGQADANDGADSCGTQISVNHGHSLQVPQADVDAGADKTYNIQGSASHPHMITVTAAQFTMLAGGTPVTVMSTTNDAHDHDVTITC